MSSLFGHSRPASTVGAVKWLAGENFLPNHADADVWVVLRFAGASVGRKPVSIGFDRLRPVELPAGWSKVPHDEYPLIKVLDENGCIRLDVLFTNTPDFAELDYSCTSCVSLMPRYKVNAELDDNREGHLLLGGNFVGVVRDTWLSVENQVVYRTRFFSSPYDATIVGEAWLDRNHAGWRDAARSWGLPRSNIIRRCRRQLTKR